MHVFSLIQRIKNGTCDVTYTLSDDPDNRSCRHRIDERLKGHEHTQAHTYKTESLNIRMLFEPDKADDCARYGTGPHKTKQAPPPIALFAKSNQRERRVRTSNMPVDCSMIPLAQPLLPL